MNNKKALKIGSSDFNTIIKDNGYFVDKTMLIEEFWENSSYILLMPRPKRFGKTLNLSMIEHFFDIQKPESAGLFTEFKISNNKEFCEQHQNKYPVINISLKDIKEINWDNCMLCFRKEISLLYKKFQFLTESDKLSDTDKHFFEQILTEKGGEIDVKHSLMALSQYLQNHFEKEVIILVDEYDTPIINAFKHTPKPIKSPKGEPLTYYQNVISFMQTFLGKAYKGNSSLKKGLLTGVMRVGRESIFSEWNNFSVFGITSPYFANSFGFTQQETEELLSDFKLDDRIYEIKKWYNGYKFGDTDNIYNPWSIVNYISRVKEGFKPYWINTGDYSIIKETLLKSKEKEEIQALIEGKTIEKELKDNFIFSDFESDVELIWTLLTYNGYLTQEEESKYGNYKLRIPNNEVKIIFTDIIMNWLNTKVKIKRDLLISTAEHLINNRISQFEIGLRKIIGDTISYFDTASVTNEQIYHVYTLGLLTILSDDFIIKSNRESGEGRYDILLMPYDKSQNGVVIEIKSIERIENEAEDQKKKRINTTRETALKQIEDRKYYLELIENKIPASQIIKVPIVFVGKKVFVCKT